MDRSVALVPSAFALCKVPTLNGIFLVPLTRGIGMPLEERSSRPTNGFIFYLFVL